MSHSAIIVIELSDWREFGSSIKTELAKLGHHGHIAVRNFMKVTFDENDNEQDRLQILLDTGNDRDNEHTFWNAPGFDYDHDLNPIGKKPADIIYAYTVDPTHTPYLVHRAAMPEVWDLTSSLTEYDAITIYDRNKLHHAALNEYWFKGEPRDAILLVYTIKEVR